MSISNVSVYSKLALPAKAVFIWVKSLMCIFKNLLKLIINDLDELDNGTANQRYTGELASFVIIGQQIRGVGLIADIPTSMSISVTAAKVFGNDSQWHNLTLPYISNTYGKRLNFGDTYVTSNIVSQGLSYLISITGSSSVPN